MIRDAADFRPMVPRRFVPVGPDVAMAGPGTRFRPDQLVDERDVPLVTAGGGTLLQLAARRR
jgi:hypothetical protein